MEIGISLASASRLPAPEAGRHLIARARAAFAAGLATLTLGDQHVVEAAGYLQNTPALGRLLAEWTGRPAGCLFLVPLWSPVLVAEHVGTLAALHDGPFIVQTGLAGSPAQHAALGTDPARRVTRFEESVRVIQGLLGGSRVDSELFGLDDVAIGLRPPGEVEWWMGTMSEPGVRRAARFRAAWYAAPGADEASYAALDDAYRAACVEHGTAARVMLRRDVVVLTNGDRARRLADDAVAAGYRGMARSALVAGDAESAAEQLSAWAGRGVDQIVMRTMGLDPLIDLETIEVMGEVRRRLAAAG